jgi:hypothetical protein
VSVERRSRLRLPDGTSLADVSGSSRGGASLPEHRLLIAIVRRAVWDFVLYRHVDPETNPDGYDLAVDAAGWLFWDGEEEVDDEGRYSFQYICSLFEMDPHRVRKHVLGLSQKDIQRLNNHMKED